MDNLELFDAYSVAGRHVRWRPGLPCTPEDLLEELDHYGVAEAMVVDSFSREFHPALGNRRASEWAAAHPRLHAGWSALPHGADDEQPAPEEFLRQMREAKAGALYLFPNQYRFTLSGWCVDALLEPLAAARVPVVINPVESGPRGPQADATDWDGLVALCHRWPNLPVIVSEYRIRRTQRLLYKALDACPNLRLELSGYWLHRGIEYITKRWGAGRLVYGSNWPAFGPHMTLATLASADIAPEERRAIGGENWRALIAWCGPKRTVVPARAPTDDYVAFGRSGRRPAGMEFSDCHGHIGEHCSHYHIPSGKLDLMVSDLERYGIRKACVFGIAGVFSDERPGNDIVAEAVRKHSDRLVGFTMLNPHRGPEEMRNELERGARMGLRGVKLIPSYQGYPEEGPHIDAACQWAHEHNQLILNHYWGSAKQMERLVATYSNACFLTGHTTTEYAEVMRRHKNLFVCSCPLLGPRECEQVVAAIGAERFLFGSDLTDLPIAWGLGPILFARIPAGQKRLILGGNLDRLLQSYSLNTP